MAKDKKEDDRLRVYLTLPQDMADMFDKLKNITGLERTDFVTLVFTMNYRKVYDALVSSSETGGQNHLTKK